MAGHSHWATIKRKKEAVDAKRGKAFTKIVKEISMCAKTHGGDPAMNPRLRQLIDKAKDINMPQDNITRAIKKGTGELPGTHYEAHMYEGYGPHGIAVIVEALTDNKNRTVSDVRRIFTNNGGSLGETNSVSWMFERLGVVRVSGQGLTEDRLLELLLDFDIKNISCDDNLFTISADIKSLEAIKEVLKAENLTIESAEVEWVAQNTITLSADQAAKAYEFLEMLEENDDVQEVYTNLVEE